MGNELASHEAFWRKRYENGKIRCVEPIPGTGEDKRE
jgi:hypothetical protein